MTIQDAQRKLGILALSVVSALTSGCVVFVSAGCDWDHSPAVWTEETVQLAIDSSGLTAMEVRTDNGEIDFTGQPAGTPGTVAVRKKAGGRDMEEAKAAMDAIEITSERLANGEQKLGWRWKGFKKSNWAADVAFAIQAPGNIRLDAETHNGAVTATGLTGDVQVTTHNGKIKVDSRSGKLDAETHNGAIAVTYAGPSITLETHNGEIKADLRESERIRGDMTTHNGAIEISVGSSTAADVVAETNNGRVSHDASITVGSSEKSRLEGKIGPGGERLELSTHNGSISIKAAG